MSRQKKTDVTLLSNVNDENRWLGHHSETGGILQRVLLPFQWDITPTVIEVV